MKKYNFKNKYEVANITLQETIYPYCPLGKDYYKAKLTITLYPEEDLADFIYVRKKLQELSGKNLIIEEVGKTVKELISEIYNIDKSRVHVGIEADSYTHLPVEIEF